MRGRETANRLGAGGAGDEREQEDAEGTARSRAYGISHLASGCPPGSMAGRVTVQRVGT